MPTMRQVLRHGVRALLVLLGLALAVQTLYSGTLLHGAPVPLAWKDVLVLTAHPDDECMFFAPAIQHFVAQNASVSALCLSRGTCGYLRRERRGLGGCACSRTGRKLQRTRRAARECHLPRRCVRSRANLVGYRMAWIQRGMQSTSPLASFATWRTTGAMRYVDLTLISSSHLTRTVYPVT